MYNLTFRKIDVIEDAMGWAETGKREVLEKLSVDCVKKWWGLKEGSGAGIKKNGQREGEGREEVGRDTEDQANGAKC